MIKGPYVNVPRTAQAGEIVPVKAKLKHPMETGWRQNRDGKTVPRNRIHAFFCAFNGIEVFRADLHSGVSADPYLMFPLKVAESGVLRLTWIEDGGREYTASAEIEVG